MREFTHKHIDILLDYPKLTDRVDVKKETSILYWYEADVLRIVDGDTVDVSLRLGCGVTKKERLRLSRIDAWESRGEERKQGLIAKAWLINQIGGKRITVNTQLDKIGKFGRLTAEIHLDNVCLNDELVRLGHAVYKNY